MAGIDSFTLNDGESRTIEFFDFITEETPPANNDIKGGIGRFSLEARFFLSPEIDITSTGSGGWGVVSWNFLKGMVRGTKAGGLFKWDSDTFQTTLSDGNTWN